MSGIDACELAALPLDASGRITAWDERCDRVFGAAASAALRQPFSSLLAHAAQRDAFEQLYAALRDGGQVSPELRYDVLATDGRQVPCRFRLIPQRDKRHTFVGCIVLVTEDTGDAGQVAHLPLGAFLDFVAGPLYVIDDTGHFVLWNKQVERVTQLNPDQLSRISALDLFDGDDKRLVAQKIEQVFEAGGEILVEADVRARDGGSTPFLLSGMRLACGHSTYLAGMGIDLSKRRQQEAMLRLRERALHASSNGIVITRCAGHDNPIEYVNPAFARITGYAEHEVLGRDARFMAAPGLDLAERAELRAAIDARRETRVVLRNRHKDGALFWNELTITPVAADHGAVTHFIGVLNDVTAAKQRTAHLEHEVNHDALTGLANRNLLWDRLDQALHQARRNKTLVATLLLDLNHFKQINDTLGHEAGDEVLTMVAKRLQASVREVDTVARLAGDEFVLVLTDQPSLRFTMRMLERLRAGLARPVAIDSKEITISASIGVSLFPHDGATVADLVHAADVAMYHAKQCGLGDAHFFSDDMKSSTEAKQQLEASLRNAVGNDEIVLLFQPTLCLHTGKVAGIEALLRWRHPVRGLLLPEAFLADAEENGAIVPIGVRVCELACELLAHLRQHGMGAIPVSINVSYREFSQADFLAQLKRCLGLFDVEPACLTIELREQDLMRNPMLGADTAHALQAIGVRLAVDHFGAGQSNLALLEKLPIAQLHLSPACIRDIGDGGLHGVLAKTMVDIAHNLLFAVVAEGVETADQAAFLRASGCDQLQGSYYSAPLARAALYQLLAHPPAATP